MNKDFDRITVLVYIQLLDDYQELVTAKGHAHAEAFVDCVFKRRWVEESCDSHNIWLSFWATPNKLKREVSDKLRQVDAVKRRYMSAKTAKSREY